MTQKLALTINAWIDSIYKYNQDLVIVFDGAEGAGKSTLMRQVGAYAKKYIKDKHNLDVTFGIDNIKFDLDDYTKTAIDKEKEKGVIHVLDESRAVANRKKSTSKGNVGFTNYLSECRSAGHIHLIALPAYHDLDAYIAIWRCSFLIHIDKYFTKVREENGVPIYELRLGEYKVFLNDSRLKAMYYHKMRYIYPKKCVFSGTFSNVAIVDEQAYEEKKQAARKVRYDLESDEKNKGKQVTKQELAIQYKAKYPKLTNVEIAKRVGCNRSTVQEALASLNV